MARRHTLSALFSWRGALTAPDSGLSYRGRLVGLVLSLHMNEAGESCFPSVATIAAECALSRRAVFYGLKELREGGWLALERRYAADGLQTSSAYTATVPPEPAEVIPRGCTPCTPGVHDVHAGGAQQGCTPCTQRASVESANRKRAEIARAPLEDCTDCAGTGWRAVGPRSVERCACYPPPATSRRPHARAGPIPSGDVIHRERAGIT